MKNWRYDWNQYSNMHALHAYITKGLKAIYIVLHWEENLIYFIILIWLVRGPLHFTLQACAAVNIYRHIFLPYLHLVVYTNPSMQICRKNVTLYLFHWSFEAEKQIPYTWNFKVLYCHNYFLRLLLWVVWASVKISG